MRLVHFSAVALNVVASMSTALTPHNSGEGDVLRVNFSVGDGTSGPGQLSKTLASLSIEFCYIIDYLGEPHSPNKLSRQLLQNIQDITGAPPIIRIGGHTQDVARYYPHQQSTLENTFSPVNEEAVNVSFNAGLFRSMNTNDNISYPLAEVSAAEEYLLPRRLISYELGNEPDFYNVQRPGLWNLDVYVQQQETWLSEIRTRVHDHHHGFQVAAFAQEPIYMGNFSLVGLNRLGLSQTVGNIQTYSDHTYPFSQCDAERAALVSLPNLMNHISTIQYFSQWSTEIAAVKSAGGSFVMGETGSVSCHGKEGVSNTLGAALWEIDYMLHGATLGMHGVYFHMGTPFFYSMWQPVEYNGTAANVYPTYYSLLFLASLVSRTEGLVVRELLALESSDLALYGIFDEDRLSKLVVLNTGFYNTTTTKRPELTLDVSPIFAGRVRVSRLTGRSSAETDSNHVLWQGQSYSNGYADGPRNLEYASPHSVKLAASGAIIVENV